jgi:CspA family cold shock protein
LSIENKEALTGNRITGKVKWFNNKVGFGFITAVDGDLKDKDIFVHYSSINVPDEQYKYLVQGEYVEFELTASDKSEHEFHAMNISGVKGGSLMCETRKSTLDSRPYKPRVYKTPDSGEPVKERTFKPKHRETTSEEKEAPRKRVYKRDSSVKDSEGYTKIPVRKPKHTTK